VDQRAVFQYALGSKQIRGALLPDYDVGIMCSEWLAGFFMCCDTKIY